MGEYINIKGKGQVKLGTCEDLFYTSFQDYCKLLLAGELSQVSGNDSPQGYIAGSYRFRFPMIHENRGFDAGIQISVPRELELSTKDHREICRSIESKSGGYHFNVFMPCPCSGKFQGVKTSVGPHSWATHDLIAIVQQRPLDGLLWTVLRCDYCGTAYRIDKDDAEKLAFFIRSEYCDQPGVTQAKYYHQLADEILAGYDDNNLCALMVKRGYIKAGQAVEA